MILEMPEIDSKGKSAPIYASFLTSYGYGSSLLAKELPGGLHVTFFKMKAS
jgi:hypothetical protein